jgi:hypothetical protein
LSYRNLYVVRHILSETAKLILKVLLLCDSAKRAWLGTNISLLRYRLRTHCQGW